MCALRRVWHGFGAPWPHGRRSVAIHRRHSTMDCHASRVRPLAAPRRASCAARATKAPGIRHKRPRPPVESHDSPSTRRQTCDSASRRTKTPIPWRPRHTHARGEAQTPASPHTSTPSLPSNGPRPRQTPGRSGKRAHTARIDPPVGCAADANQRRAHRGRRDAGVRGDAARGGRGAGAARAARRLRGRARGRRVDRGAPHAGRGGGAGRRGGVPRRLRTADRRDDRRRRALGPGLDRRAAAGARDRSAARWRRA